jgi:class 3 adenylate cyclase
MESHGRRGDIHVTSEVADALKIKGNYRLESRGTISVKGKGRTETFFLFEE